MNSKQDELNDFFSFDIPEKPKEYEVDFVLDNAFILKDKNGNGIKVVKTKDNSHWKKGDMVRLEEKK